MHITSQPILPALRRFTLYARSLEFASVVLGLQVQGTIRDQLHRATESVVFNVAEGAGCLTLPAKARYWTIARASLWEATAALDVLALKRGVTAERPRLESLARELDAMLAALVRRR